MTPEIQQSRPATHPLVVQLPHTELEATSPTQPAYELSVKPVERPELSKPVQVSIVGTFLILLLGALHYARDFFLPLILALLITLTFSPLLRLLSRRGIPAGVSAVALVLILGGSVVAISGLLVGPLSSMVSEAPEVAEQVRERFAFLRRPFAMLNNAAQELSSLANGGPSGSQADQVVVTQSGLVGWLAGAAAGLGTTLGVTLILTIFLLASSEMLRQKLVHVLPELSGKKKSLRVLRDIENEVSRYLLTIAAINAGFGLCVGLAMQALGMPHAVLWGIGAGLLNFVPFIGGVIGMALLVAVASVTYPAVTVAALPPLAYFGIQMVENNFVTPMILGRRLELSPLSIIIFLALTTWLWGFVGTLIGVPLLVAVKVFSDSFPSLSLLGEFLSAVPVQLEARVVSESSSEDQSVRGRTLEVTEHDN